MERLIRNVFQLGGILGLIFVILMILGTFQEGHAGKVTWDKNGKPKIEKSNKPEKGCNLETLEDYIKIKTGNCGPKEFKVEKAQKEKRKIKRKVEKRASDNSGKTVIIPQLKP